jgi:glycine dehydrogenase subunit 1
MGKEGLREVGTQCLQKAAYLRDKLQQISSVVLPFRGPIYNEFVVRTPFKATEILADLEHEKILAGVPLSRFFPDMPNDFLVAVTELHTREKLDHFAAALSAAISRERR